MQMTGFEMPVAWLQCGNNLMSMYLNTFKFIHGRRAVKKVMSVQSWYDLNMQLLLLCTLFYRLQYVYVF